jgi:predicted CoA-substrate-specific enzyme activase
MHNPEGPPRAYIGIDVGAVSTNLALIDPGGEVFFASYLRTGGDPLSSIARIMAGAHDRIEGLDIGGCAATGSGRHLAAALVGADMVKNEITAHAAGALHFCPGARTVIEVGGQDSKIIIIEHRTVVDFAVNNVCAAGTGSFLDHQASRMNLSIDEFSEMAAGAAESVHIPGRCTVFAETDIIQKQQMGASRDAIARGLCESLVRNYLANVASGKRIRPPVVFQGGVASNIAVRKAFEKELGTAVTVPPYHNVMGAIGAALLIRAELGADYESVFRNVPIEPGALKTRVFECEHCPNSCDILEIFDSGVLISRWGSRCGRWDLDA